MSQRRTEKRSGPVEDGPEGVQKICVGLDVDTVRNEVCAGSRMAALQARLLAEKTGARIRFLHSTARERHGRDDPEVGGDPSPDAVALLEGFAAEEARTGVSTEVTWAREPAWLALIRAAIAGEADLVVVGKRSDIAPDDDRKLGTVAVKLLRMCPAPVWVVHPQYGLVHDTVLAATDLTPVGDRATALGAAVARLFGAGLHVVHAYQIPMSVQLAADAEEAEGVAAIERAAREEVRDALGDAAPDAELHLACTTPSRAIGEAVYKLAPDLLVMGTLSRGGVAGLLVGNTAERLLDRVDCSLLTIKPADFASPIEG